MQELGRHVRDNTQILFGTAVDGRMGNRLSVTILSSIATDEELAPPQTTFAAPPVSAPIPIPVQPIAPPPPIWEQPLAPAEAMIESSVEEEMVAPIPEEESIAGAPEDLIPLEAPVSIEAPIPPAPKTQKPIPGPRLIVPKKRPVVVKEPAMPTEKIVQAKQEVMQFEPVTRGRFEKSEPTIVEGQDLDVPTYLRKNVRVK
jgi:cell division protein FtsZ